MHHVKIKRQYQCTVACNVRPSNREGHLEPLLRMLLRTLHIITLTIHMRSQNGVIMMTIHVCAELCHHGERVPSLNGCPYYLTMFLTTLF